jgi:hypothetical protein
MKYNIMDTATLRVFDLNHAPKSAMKADCSEHDEAAGAVAQIKKAPTHTRGRVTTNKRSAFKRSFPALVP